MPPIVDYLLTAGICELPELYTKEEIAAINAAVEPLLSSRLAEKRSYVHPEEMMELGVMKMVFKDRMMDVLFSIMPDPVLYHCHIYEIAANNTTSHIFGDSLRGWHRDPDSSYVEGDPTHVSIFIYLTDVGPDDGAFEFIPSVPPTKWLHSGTPFIAAQGQRGYSFAWHRNYYHRASPNRGPVRRRLFKLSIQSNEYPSHHLANPHFSKLIAETPKGDTRWDLLLGRYQGKAAPHLDPLPSPQTAPISTNGVLNLSGIELTKAQLRDKARHIRDSFRAKKTQVVAAYD
jgi:hypothetical protein